MQRKKKRKNRSNRAKAFGVYGAPLAPDQVTAILATDTIRRELTPEVADRLKFTPKFKAGDPLKQRRQLAGLQSLVAGERAEQRILRLLEELSQKDDLAFRVAAVEQTKPHYPLIDIWVHTTVEISLPIQVKAGSRAAVTAQSKLPSIICVSSRVWNDDELREILRERMEERFAILSSLL